MGGLQPITFSRVHDEICECEESTFSTNQERRGSGYNYYTLVPE